MPAPPVPTGPAHRLAPGAWILLALAPALPLPAQTVVGTVVDADSGAPLSGAFVRLTDGGGESVASDLTDAVGRYRLEAPGPGAYRLRAQFIGREPVERPEVRLELGEVLEWSPRLGTRPIMLEGIEVESGRRCRSDPEEGSLAARLWEEARTALSVASWSTEAGLLRYELVHFTRELDAETRRVVRDDRRRSRSWLDRPFVSRDPDELAREGFVQSRGDGDFAYAPDAAVLLSDAFGDTHCFGVTAGEEGRVGLTFEPTPGRGVTDIRGVLWLDTETSELRSLEYRYVGFPDVDPSVELGGEVVFQRLPTGLWIVRRWSMDLPIRGEVRRAGSPDLFDYPVVAIHQTGGEVGRAVDARGRAVLSTQRATLGGVVFDSIRGEPIAGARVSLVGTEQSATTVDDGSFLLGDVPEGRYTLAVAHPRLDSLRLPAPTRPVDLTAGATAWASLALPRRSPLEAGEPPRLHGEFAGGGDATPVRAGLVEVVDVRDRLVERLLTDRRGRYVVVLPEPGGYRVRLRRVGHRTLETPPLEIAPATAHYRSDPAPPEPVPRADAAGLRALGASCALRPDPTSGVGHLWAQARTALDGLVAAQDAQRYTARLTLRTEMRPTAGSRLEARADRRTIFDAAGHQFAPVPVDTAGRPRFVEGLDSSLVTHPPGPRLLVSPWFEGRYCFEPSSGEPPAGGVALTFRPVSPNTEVDVVGSLVFDAETLELRSYHYRYVGLPRGPSDAVPGGWMTFARLPSGERFLTAWDQRLPAIGRVRDADAPRAARRTWVSLGTHLDGGRVEEAQASGATSVWRPLDADFDGSEMWDEGAGLDDVAAEEQAARERRASPSDTTAGSVDGGSSSSRTPLGAEAPAGPDEPGRPAGVPAPF